ncbi:hypothetical protein C2845_PM15G04320 [Panicum miliaceum]|uniref:Acireductone dioxygenase n=1 Tax=Panicum miliaceum TaxID=4540 RepID=A0A3L6Q7K3_PANMI|nr:hypothetical protein C2845_PM15G04320 [Panicum miliaceum]
MVNKRGLLTKFVLLALLVLQTREVRANSRVESFVHDELQFGQGLGFPSIISFHGDSAHDILNGVGDVVQAWYMDDTTEEEDQRLPHRRQPDVPVPLAKLLGYADKSFGVHTRKSDMHVPLKDLGIVAMRLDADNHENDENLTMIRGLRGYLHMDIVTLTPEKMPNYEAMIKRFFEEHLHAHEEVCYCLEGSGYFDVRDEEDRWVRVSVRKGGLIVVPAGIYHRFTLNTNNYIKVRALLSHARSPSSSVLAYA